MKSYVIVVTNKHTGAHVFSRTNNLKQRIKRLEENILSINGQGTAIFDRFVPFVGCTLKDVEFTYYKQVDAPAF